MALLFQARDPGSMDGPSLPQVSSLRTPQSLTPPDATWPRGTGQNHKLESPFQSLSELGASQSPAQYQSGTSSASSPDPFLYLSLQLPTSCLPGALQLLHVSETQVATCVSSWPLFTGDSPQPHSPSTPYRNICFFSLSLPASESPNPHLPHDRDLPNTVKGHQEAHVACVALPKFISKNSVDNLTLDAQVPL